ncbi:hypothetical protein PB2503_07734 [Parvularcula bermudensis HTCC2503]|uniref:Uncharacterized protein n=1 Tax=Parvularcula bermudensis (strain ATCC BAA-594 / HTCC2503 / KCTC 12087) TaxID=314260 RepID=E0TGI3_PARBH|nr:hypothetical protein [Parvularcula bermudensis]ADM09602.1 hypothetical protein PB2503_07734 [Parvularcula bermudensis HTCC2503]
MFSMVPLLVISLILYTIGLFAGGGEQAFIDRIFLDPTLVSGNKWQITFGDAFLTLSMGLLFIELLRATETGTDSLVNHSLSALLFVAALLLFIIMPGFGNSVFFIYMLMTFLDFMAGFIVTTKAARRDFGVS